MVERNELIKEEALRIMQAAEEQGMSLPLLGGMAVYLVSPCTRQSPYTREINDLDFVVSKRKAYALEKLMAKIGVPGDREFNSVHGESRLYFASELVEVDVFVGTFAQCHAMDLEKYLRDKTPTLPLAVLLLTKLQVVQINQKDIIDILALLHDHEVAADGDPHEVISLKEFNAVMSDDWGWYTSCMDNLEKIQTEIRNTFDRDGRQGLSEKITRIQIAAMEARKSVKWLLRSKVGRKMQWYQLPEEKQI